MLILICRVSAVCFVGLHVLGLVCILLNLSVSIFALLNAQAVWWQRRFMMDGVACSWIVITALCALLCTGAVLGFVFMRGFVPSPYDAITISNSGNGGYAGSNGGYASNNGYHGYVPPFLLLLCHDVGCGVCFTHLSCPPSNPFPPALFPKAPPPSPTRAPPPYHHSCMLQL